MVQAIYEFYILIFFFFNDTATTEIYTLSLHDALPILRDSLEGYFPAVSSASSRACPRGPRLILHRVESVDGRSRSGHGEAPSRLRQRGLRGGGWAEPELPAPFLEEPVG